MIMRQNNKKSREIFAGFFRISVCSPIRGEQQINSEQLILEKRHALQDVTDSPLTNAVTYIADMAAVSAATVCSSESDGLSFVCSGKNGT